MHVTLTLNLFPSNSTPSFIALFKLLMESSNKSRLSGLFPPTEIESGNTFAGLIFTMEHKTGYTEVYLLLKMGKPSTFCDVYVPLSKMFL